MHIKSECCCFFVSISFQFSFRSAILQCFFRFTWCTSHSRPFKIFPIALFHNDCTISTLLWLSLRFLVLMMFSFDTPKLNEKWNQKAQRNFINTFQCYERYEREKKQKKTRAKISCRVNFCKTLSIFEIKLVLIHRVAEKHRPYTYTQRKK